MSVRERFQDVDEREKLIREMLEDATTLFHWDIHTPKVNEDLRFGFVVGCRAAFYRLINDRS